MRGEFLRLASIPAPGLLIPAAVFLALSAILGARISAAPMQPYGADTAHYIEHTARLDVLQTLRELELGEGKSDTIRTMIEDLDGSFPPLLHLVTAALGALTGHAAEDVLWSGLLWLLLLAAAVGGIARYVSGSRLAAAAALCGTLLLPALHASATRYYYDLPMTALLWLAVFVLLRYRSRGVVVAGLLAGALLFVADITKWTALPFGLIMLAGAIFTSGDARRGGSDGGRRATLRARLAAGALAVLLSSLLVLGFLELAGNHDSFTAMLGDIGERGEIWGPQGVDSDRPAAIAGHIFRDLQPLSRERLSFYGIRAVTSVFSPGLLAITLLLTAVWALRSRRGWPLILITLVGQAAFLLLRIPPTDDRFLLTMAPALVLAAALGWERLGLRPRQVVGALVIGLGLAVAIDFHSADPADIQPPARALGQEELGDLLLWGLNDSADQRGWARRDRQRDNRDAARESLWGQLSGCRADVIKVASERSVVSDHSARGDLYWLRYRALLDHLEEERPQRRILLSCDEAHGDETEVALSAVRPDTRARRPRCIAATGWKLEGLVRPDPDSREVAIWSRHGRRICDGLK